MSKNMAFLVFESKDLSDDEFAAAMRKTAEFALSMGVKLGNTGEILDAMAKGNFERSEAIDQVLARWTDAE